MNKLINWILGVAACYALTLAVAIPLAISQQPPRPSDEEIDARFQVFSAKLAAENSRTVALEARVMVLTAENERLKKEIEAAKPKPEAKK